MSSIFISYRRAGTSGYGGRLQEDLRDHFGRERVFRDIDSIRPGSDFALVIEEAVAGAGVVLALIGSSWLHATNGSGKRRLEDPDDFVRLEIESAIKRGIVVVPVLVEGARMPSPSELPPSIRRLSRTQGIELTEERWDYDLRRLVTALEEILASPSGAVAAAPPTGEVTATTPASPLTLATPATEVVELGPGPPAAAATIGARIAHLIGNRRLITATALSLALLLVFGVLVAVSGSDAPRRLALPAVVDQDLAAATLTLERAGFVVRTEVVPSDRPGGLILAQDPAPGTKAEKGATVALSVSGNTSRPAVPMVVNLTQAEAVARIQEAGLVATVVEEQNAGVAAGTVLLQSPEAMVAVEKGAAVTITVSTGMTVPSTATAPITSVIGPPGSVVPTTGPPPRGTRPPGATTTLPPPLPRTGNLVNNPGAEASGASAPFTAGQPPTGWSRGAHQAIAASYGARGSRSGCTDASYPSVAELEGSGARLFTGGYGPNGGCDVAGGSVPTLVQAISLSPFAGRTDGIAWEASARLASYPGSGDNAALTVDVLGASGQRLASVGTGPISNSSGPAFQTRVLQGRLPVGATSVRVTLSFGVSNSYSGGFADDVSFRIG